jgi:hypothetical protein
VSESPHVAVVRAFYQAFNDERLDDFVTLLDPAVELQTARGLREGRDEAREWARRNPSGGLEQRLVLDEVREDEHGVHAVALIRKQWWWVETSEVAHDEPEAALFTFREDLIARWQPFEDREAALRAAGIDGAD